MHPVYAKKIESCINMREKWRNVFTHTIIFIHGNLSINMQENGCRTKTVSVHTIQVFFVTRKVSLYCSFILSYRKKNIINVLIHGNTQIDAQRNDHDNPYDVSAHKKNLVPFGYIQLLNTENGKTNCI